MITFDPREPAPVYVRWARVIVALFLCFAYPVFRLYPAVHERIGLTELLASGALFITLTFVAFITLGDLLYPATSAERAAEDDPESTGVFGSVALHDLAAVADRGCITGRLPGPSTWAAELCELADDEACCSHAADTEEFELLTHEYVPQHHTPARGFLAPALQATADRLERDARAMVPRTITGRIAEVHRIAGQLPTPEPRIGGRHRLVKD